MVIVAVIGVAAIVIFIWRFVRLERRLSALEARMEYVEMRDHALPGTGEFTD